jgi:hypothetical protein
MICGFREEGIITLNDDAMEMVEGNSGEKPAFKICCTSEMPADELAAWLRDIADVLETGKAPKVLLSDAGDLDDLDMLPFPDPGKVN